MKVLFAIGDAVTSENIVKQYYSLYGEKIEYKNVFYFKALLEEVKKDKTYDRIVIAEQLEPPQRNLVDAIDQMLFNNIDSITDEIEDSTIIFICSDGRTKNDSLIGRLFNIGIYNLLMGDERDIVPLCGLIKNPRNKKEAKEYLKSNPAIGDTAALASDDEKVDDQEIMNISRFFSNLKTPEEYLKNFAIVEEQYNEKQLQVITLSLKKYLKKGEEIYSTLYMDPRFSKYCPVALNKEEAIKKVENASKPGILGFLSGKKMKNNSNNNMDKVPERTTSATTTTNGPIEKMPDNNEIITKSVAFGAYVVDEVKDNIASRASAEAESMMDKSQQEAKALSEQLRRESEERRRKENELKAQQEAQLRAQQEAQLRAQQEAQLKAQQEAQLRAQQEAQLRAQQEAQLRAQQEAQLKAQQEAQLRAQQEAQLRAQQEAQLKAQKEAQLKAQQEAQLRAQQEAQLRAQQEAQLKAQQEARIRAEQERIKAEQEALQKQREALQREQQANQINNPYMMQNTVSSYQNQAYQTESYETEKVASNVTPIVVPADYKKVVAFIGTNKVGTSFIVNSIATLMAQKGVKTSILDMTKTRGMYWFYSDAAYKKSDIVATCMSGLSNGVANPISVGKYKNLNLYTTIPGGKEDNRKGYRHRNIIETARKNCNLLIIDCDFTTPYEYLEQASEIYIVQDLDLIKAQETIEFFRELKAKKMDWGKLRAVMNNCVKCKVTSKKILKNALTYYNDPTMTFTEEFEEIKKFVEVPLDIQNYSNYIEGMQDGKLNYEKYTPEFKDSMERLSTMVYGAVGAKRRGFFG